MCFYREWNQPEFWKCTNTLQYPLLTIYSPIDSSSYGPMIVKSRDKENGVRVTKVSSDLFHNMHKFNFSIQKCITWNEEFDLQLNIAKISKNAYFLVHCLNIQCWL